MEELLKQIQILKDNLNNCPLPEPREDGDMLQFYLEHNAFNDWACEQEAKIEELENQLRLIQLKNSNHEEHDNNTI